MARPVIIHQLHRLHTSGDVLCAIDCVRALPDFRHRFFVKYRRGIDPRVPEQLAALGVSVQTGTIAGDGDLTPEVAAVLYHCIGYDEARPGVFIGLRIEHDGVARAAWIHTPGLCGRPAARYAYFPQTGISRLAFSSTFTREQTPDLQGMATTVALVIPPTAAGEQFADVTRTDDVFRVGRWSRPDDRKFADDYLDLLASLDMPGAEIECMGVPPKFRGAALPPNVRLLKNHALPLEQFLGRLDILLFKTDERTWHEGWCRTVTEAMAAGVIPVVEDRGGVTDQIINGYNGYLCGTNAEFKAACEALYRDPELRARMRASARAFARREFNLARLRRKLVELLDLNPAR